ncbi:methylmalonyl-CoA mutase family protein [Nocardioides bigeumensis]|uniref:Methylmalonyl-CoA mutase family protein n=1 Tax=Nocardioides bigeumensis TaxID=433657 RepID=A0ABN2YJT5_9ACTN
MTTRADWEHAAAGVLRKAGRLGEGDPDAAVWDALTRRTLDGIAVTPLGTPADLEGVDTDVRPTRHGAWDVRVEVRGDDARALNEQVLADLETGANSLWVHSAHDLPTLLDGVLLDLAPVVLDLEVDHLAHARDLVDHLRTHLTGAAPATGTNLGVPATADDATLREAAELAAEAGTLAFVVDALDLHHRGASEVQELAWSVAAGVRLLRSLEAGGLDATTAAGLVEFRYAATDEQFPSIAKLRAARRLWARILDASGAGDAAQRQHAVTSRAMLSTYDPHVNLLRTTVAAFAAGVGGADAVTVVPFDSPLGKPDTFGRRIARNTSAVLLAEAQLGRVADPAGGAYAVERLTHDLAAAAWDLFVRLDEGADLDRLVADTVAERDRLVATRRRPITGLTEFPHLGEVLPVREPDPGAPPVRRYGAAFEALRDVPADATVFLATLGPVAAHTARASFAANLLAAGGIAVDTAGPTTGVDDLVAAYDEQQVVCLAGTDSAYAAWGAEAAAALRAAGAQHVVIAGKPVDYADDACSVGADALAFLTRTREVLG